MAKEKNIQTITTLLNLLVAIIKFASGMIFNFSALLADSLQSFADFITDIIANIASKIGKRKANKKHPFGYGMIENISNLLMGIILFCLGIYILIESFHSKEVIIKPIIFIILIITIILKLIIVFILYSTSKKLKSPSLLLSAKESSLDLISSSLVLIVSILLLYQEKYPILKYSNSIASILISIIIFNISIKIILENIEYLLGINENNQEIITKITKIISQNKKIKDSNIKLMKIGNYYNLYLSIKLDNHITVKQLFNLENKLKKEIRKANLKIRFITIEPKEYK